MTWSLHKTDTSPQGWSGPKELHGEYIEGSFKAHQVPLPESKTDANERAMLQEWLLSYGPKELFGESGVPNDAILSVIPKEESKRVGMREEAYKSYTPLEVPDWKQFAVEKGSAQSCMKITGELVDAVSQTYALSTSLLPDGLTSRLQEPDCLPYLLP